MQYVTNKKKLVATGGPVAWQNSKNFGEAEVVYLRQADGNVYKGYCTSTSMAVRAL
jgi:hypothetical protein